MAYFLRLLLWPLSLLYGAVIAIRNKLYDHGVFKSKKFNFPVIVIGNLAVGGTGKSPLTEYLIRVLKDSYRIAILSRGYGRKTKGFMYVEESDNSDMAGDEPLQFKTKYPKVTVVVSENRVLGVEKLMDKHHVIILDDAYQHRALTPSFSILLLDYSSLFKPRLLLPAGDFRDTYNQRKRANIIIVSKSPIQLSEQEKNKAIKKVAANTNQLVLFSFLDYGKPYCITNCRQETNILLEEDEVLLVTGIANPKPLLSYLEERCDAVHLLAYPDHHSYTQKDIKSIVKRFQSMSSDKKYIVTTEKDFQRLRPFLTCQPLVDLPIWVVPIEAGFSEKEKKQLSSIIFKAVGEKFNNNH